MVPTLCSYKCCISVSCVHKLIKMIRHILGHDNASIITIITCNSFYLEFVAYPFFV